MKIIEHNIETGEIVERDATSQEIDQLEADAEKLANREEAKAQAAAQKAALLEKLGITEEEAKLFLS